MKISVLIPVYNSEKYLENTIFSVINQTFKDIEIIIVNDGSNDNSLSIIEKIALDDKRIKVINKKNTGYGDSLNTALKEAQGEYISIVEADDFIDNKMLEKLYKSRGDYDIIKCSFFLLNKNKAKYYNVFKGIDTKKIQNARKTPKILTLKPAVWSAIYKKSFLKENNILFNTSSGASFQDISFQFKALFLASKIKLLNEALYYYRIDNPHSSINSSDKVFEICAEFFIINDFLSREEVTINQINQKILFEFLAYIWNYRRIKKKYKDIFLDKIVSIISKYDIKSFLKDKKIPLKQKIKFYFFIKNKNIFKLYLNIINNYANKKFYNSINKRDANL